MIPKRSVVTCHAPHPDKARKKGDACGRTLMKGEVPAALEFVTIADEAPEQLPDGSIWLQCPRKQCGKWNRFRIVVARGTLV